MGADLFAKALMLAFSLVLFGGPILWIHRADRARKRLPIKTRTSSRSHQTAFTHKGGRTLSKGTDGKKCGACGGCGILICSWDTLGAPKDGVVFVDTCDTCTTGVSDLHRGDAAEAIAIALTANILLVQDEGHSFKDAVVAPLRDVEELLKKWNEGEPHWWAEEYLAVG